MIVVLAITTVLTLSALALGGMALLQARSVLQSAGRRNQELRQLQESRIEALEGSLANLKAEIREIELQPAGGAGILKPGLNLGKRSQALRMHRRGETAAQIASTLDIPPQEVELLIKVHRIVLSKI